MFHFISICETLAAATETGFWLAQ